MAVIPICVFPPVLVAAPLLLLEPSPPVEVRILEVDRGSTVRRPVAVEILNRTKDVLMLKVDERIVLVSSRGESRWTLAPERWVRGSGSQVVVLQVSLSRNGRLRVVHEQKVRVGAAAPEPRAP